LFTIYNYEIINYRGKIIGVEKKFPVSRIHRILERNYRSQNKEFSKGILIVKQLRVETTIPNFRESTVLYKQSTLLQLLLNLSEK